MDEIPVMALPGHKPFRRWAGSALRMILNLPSSHPTGDSKSALKAFEQSPPQIILSEIGLPEMDDNALMRQIRALENSRQLDTVPAIALSDLFNRQTAKQRWTMAFSVSSLSLSIPTNC